MLTIHERSFFHQEFIIMSVSLYRKYRPQDFASVVGQTAAVSILTNALSKGSAGHAYLFSGSRGCGKTSIARIFAKALNCLHPNGYEPCGQCSNCTAVTAGESLDVVEIDGASNNGVENIRNIRSNVSLAPFSSKHKIYIIDEVHMLSQGAFNALLKTLEEPPEYVIFIMATTEPYKVPVTIRSRCQHIPFHSISTEDISERLAFVCREEGVSADVEALYEIARQADGALRDGLSLLEQVISAGEITLSNVEALLGAGSRSAFERVVQALRTDPPQGYASLKAMFDGGASSVRVFEELFSLVRNMWLVSRWGGLIDSLGLPKSERVFLNNELPHWKSDTLHILLDRSLKALTKARQGIRTDILLGSFMLSLEPVPVQQETLPVQQNTPQIPQAAPQIPQDTPPFQQEALPVQQEVHSAFDPQLTLELLNLAQNAQPEIYCALLDVQAHTENKGLILDVQHNYCYNKLMVDHPQAQLCSMFGKYGEVFLRYRGSNEFKCTINGPVSIIPYPEYNVQKDIPEQNISADVQEDIPQQNTSADVQEDIPEQNISADVQEDIPEQNISADVQEDIPEQNISADVQEDIPEQNISADVQKDIPEQNISADVQDNIPKQDNANHSQNKSEFLHRLREWVNYTVLLTQRNDSQLSDTIEGDEPDNDS